MAEFAVETVAVKGENNLSTIATPCPLVPGV